MAKRRACYSGIGGQAVLEGIMMRNKDKYSVAVRKPNGEIEVEIDEYTGTKRSGALKKLPFFRGVFNFVDSLVLGMKSLNFSAGFYEEEESNETKFDRVMQKIFKGNTEKVLTGFVGILSVILAVGIFILLPYFLSSFITAYVRNETLITLIEGIIRILIFIIYIVLISINKDIKRVYRYHGAEHKCINCIEHGNPLTVENVLKSSRFHKRCGTSFLLFVVLLSVVLFFFIRVESPLMRIVVRLLMIPVIAGIAYEFLRLAGKSNNIVVRIISAPGLWLQRITTKEPDEKMVEVAIQAVEAVFDWRDFLKEKFDWTEDAAPVESQKEETENHEL